MQDETRNDRARRHAARSACEVDGADLSRRRAAGARCCAGSSSAPSATPARAMMPIRLARRSATSRCGWSRSSSRPPRALGQKVFDLPRRRRVEAGERLVEHEELGSWISAPASAAFCLMPREKPSQRSRRCGQRPSVGEQKLALSRAARARRPTGRRRIRGIRADRACRRASARRAARRRCAWPRWHLRASTPKTRISPESAGKSPATMRKACCRAVRVRAERRILRADRAGRARDRPAG